jgi:hypothetical protein
LFILAFRRLPLFATFVVCFDPGFFHPSVLCQIASAFRSGRLSARDYRFDFAGVGSWLALPSSALIEKIFRRVTGGAYS